MSIYLNLIDSIKLNFHTAPFVSICISFCFGVFSGFNLLTFNQNLIILVFTFLFSIFAFTLLKNIKLIPFISTSLIFFSLGSLYVSEQNIVGVRSNFNHSYTIGNSYIINVKEVGKKQSAWKKVIGTISHLKKGKTIIECDEDIVLFIQTKDDTIQIGDRLTLNSELTKIKNKGNPGEFDSEYFWKNKGITKIGFVSNQAYIKLGNSITWFEKWSNKSRDYLGNILSKHFEGQELAVAQALILGDRSFLDSETTSAFGNSGAMHVLAVSGLHIGIILQLILYLLKAFSKLLTRKRALFVALLFIWIYTIISGLSASVLRATFMFSVLAVSQMYGKNYNPLNGLFFTGFVLLLFNPLFLFDIGFQLSFLAMIGIFWFYKPISKSWYVKNKWLRKIWEGTAVGLAAQLLTVPLTLYYFHQFPNYFILTNIGLMLSTGLILGFGMFIFGFYWVKFIGKFSVFLLTIVLTFTLYFVQFIDGLPGSISTGFVLSWQIVIVSYLIIISFYLFKNSSSKIKISLFIVSFILTSIIIFQRFNQLNTNEICFFNHSKLTFTIKQGNQIYCFYDGDTTDLKKIDFFIKSYQKIYPGEIKYLTIKEKDWKIKSNTLNVEIKKLKMGRSIKLNDRSFYVKRNEKDTAIIDGSKTLLMPWLENGNSCEYSLNKGGIQFSF